MIFTAAARELLKRLEGLRLTAYRDKEGNWTIGYGHCGRDIVEHLTWTLPQAEAALDVDIERFSETVARCVAKARLSDAQYSSLVIFAFNIGPTAFIGSTALRDVQSGRLAAVPGELRRWVFIHDASGVPIVDPILVRRREAEIALWNSGAKPLEVV
jgi:lysozyme